MVEFFNQGSSSSASGTGWFAGTRRHLQHQGGRIAKCAMRIAGGVGSMGRVVEKPVRRKHERDQFDEDGQRLPRRCFRDRPTCICALDCCSIKMLRFRSVARGTPPSS